MHFWWSLTVLDSKTRFKQCSAYIIYNWSIGSGWWYALSMINKQMVSSIYITHPDIFSLKPKSWTPSKGRKRLTSIYFTAHPQHFPLPCIVNNKEAAIWTHRSSQEIPKAKLQQKHSKDLHWLWHTWDTQLHTPSNCQLYATHRKLYSSSKTKLHFKYRL